MPNTLPVPPPSQEARKIKAMFASIAPRYDLLNRLLSGRTDVAWRRLLVREVVTGRESRVLDLACGTGDLALELRGAVGPRCEVIGADFTGPMLRLAATKPRGDQVAWIEADGLKLPFADESFDLVTIAFGIRNMESLDRALREIRRVLRPGGRLAILEFTQPDNPVVRALYMPYFLHVLPRIGAVLSQRSAYLYLPHSVLHFPNRRQLARTMIRNGYRRVRHCALTMGIAAIHVGEKRAYHHADERTV